MSLFNFTSTNPLTDRLLSAVSWALVLLTYLKFIKS